MVIVEFLGFLDSAYHMLICVKSPGQAKGRVLMRLGLVRGVEKVHL